MIVKHIAIVKLVLSINNSCIIRTRKYNADFGINVRENRRDNQVLNIQRNWQQDTRQRQKNTTKKTKKRTRIVNVNVTNYLSIRDNKNNPKGK